MCWKFYKTSVTLVIMKKFGVGKVLLGIVLIIVILLFAAELGLRMMISNQLKQDYESAGGQSASISFGASPLLLGLAQGELGHVEITAPDSLVAQWNQDKTEVEIVGTPQLHTVLEGLSLTDPDNPTAKSMQMETRISNEGLHAMLVQGMNENQSEAPNDFAAGILKQLVKVTGVSTKAATNTITVEFTDGAATIDLQPQVGDGTVKFTASNTSLFGVELPAGVSDALTQALDQGVNQLGTNGLNVDTIQVEDGGVLVAMSGNNVNLAEISTQPIG